MLWFDIFKRNYFPRNIKYFPSFCHKNFHLSNKKEDIVIFLTNWNYCLFNCFKKRLIMILSRSREARRLKENQIALRAAYLEKENKLLKKVPTNQTFQYLYIWTQSFGAIERIYKMSSSKHTVNRIRFLTE